MKRNEKKGKIRGVDVAKVSDRTVLEKLVSIGLSEDTLKGKSSALKTETLLDWYFDKMEIAKAEGITDGFGVCDNCGGPCQVDDADQKCHFCGTPYDADEPPVDVEKVDVAALAVDLDAAVARVRKVQQQELQNMWQLGRELLGIFDNKLFKKRVDENGRQVHKSWDDFAEKELGFSGPRARSFMDVAREFTEEQVVMLGVEKLRTINRLPENRRPEFIARAPELSCRELANEVSKIYKAPAALPASQPTAKEKQGEAAAPLVAPAVDAKKAALAKGTEAAKKAREEKKAQNQKQVDEGSRVTAIFQLGQYDIPLEPDGEDDFKARDVLVNGVVVTYSIKLVGKKQFMRINYSRSE